MVKIRGSVAGLSQVCDLVNVCVRAKGGDEITMLLLAVPTICEPICGQPITLASRRYPYLSVLDLADHNNIESWAYLLVQTFTGRWSLEEHGNEMGPWLLRLSSVGCSLGQLLGCLVSLPQ